MTDNKVQRGFFDAIQSDPRIGTTHISLFCALNQIKDEGGLAFFVAAELMKISKILGIATFHKCIKELNEFGYITYIPSFNLSKGKSRAMINYKI
jgi:hypothetical protein